MQLVKLHLFICYKSVSCGHGAIRRRKEVMCDELCFGETAAFGQVGALPVGCQLGMDGSASQPSLPLVETVT